MMRIPSEVWQAQDPGRTNVSAQVPSQEDSPRPSPKAVRQEEFSLIQERISLFVLFKASTDWMRPTTLGRAICFTQI